MISKWQPIETAPKDGTLILLACLFGKKRREYTLAHYRDTTSSGPYGKFCWLEISGETVAEAIPTHWMPLPDPPEV